MKQRMKWIGAVLALLLALTGCGAPSAGMPQAVTPLTCAAPTGYPEVSPAGGYDVTMRRRRRTCGGSMCGRIG